MAKVWFLVIRQYTKRYRTCLGLTVSRQIRLCNELQVTAELVLAPERFQEATKYSLGETSTDLESSFFVGFAPSRRCIP